MCGRTSLQLWYLSTTARSSIVHSSGEIKRYQGYLSVLATRWDVRYLLDELENPTVKPNRRCTPLHRPRIHRQILSPPVLPGMPKGVITTHRMLCSISRCSVRCCNFRDEPPFCVTGYPGITPSAEVTTLASLFTTVALSISIPASQGPTHLARR
jgi:hypothetical protein